MFLTLFFFKEMTAVIFLNHTIIYYTYLIPLMPYNPGNIFLLILTNDEHRTQRFKKYYEV